LILGAYSGGGEVEGFESDLESGGIGSEGELEFFRIFEFRISDQGMRVVSEGLPLREVEFFCLVSFLVARAYGILSGQVPEQVEVAAEGAFFEIGAVSFAKHLLIVPEEDIAGQGDGVVFFGASQTGLPEGAEGEDVVSDDVFAAIVHVEGFAVHVVRDVVFDDHVGAAGVEINAPSTIAVAFDVVDEIVSDDGAGLNSQHVNPAHIVDNSFPQMMDVIPCDQVVS